MTETEIKTMKQVWEDFYLLATELCSNAQEQIISPTVLPKYFWSGRSLELHAWNSEDLEIASVLASELDGNDQENVHECLSDILEILSGRTVVIPLGSPSRDLFHSLLCIFIRMVRAHTPALFDFPFVIEEVDQEDPAYVAYLEVVKWINTYDDLQDANTPVTFDESWDSESAWRLTGFVSRMLPHPMFAKAIVGQDGDIGVEAPDANYPAAHSYLESIQEIWDVYTGWEADLSYADTMAWNNEVDLILDQGKEFVSFLYKMRYIIDDEELFKTVVDQCGVLLERWFNSRISNLYEFVTEPQTLVKGLIK